MDYCSSSTPVVYLYNNQKDVALKCTVTVWVTEVLILPEYKSSLNAALHFLCQVFNIGLWE